MSLFVCRISIIGLCVYMRKRTRCNNLHVGLLTAALPWHTMLHETTLYETLLHFPNSTQNNTPPKLKSQHVLNQFLQGRLNTLAFVSSTFFRPCFPLASPPTSVLLQSCQRHVRLHHWQPHQQVFTTNGCQDEQKLDRANICNREFM